MTLAWQAPETAQEGFTYEVYIKDETGNVLNCIPTIVGGTNDGIRKVNALGRVGCLKEWLFRPTKPGTYSWGVQTIDAAYNGSVFTEGPQFTITEEDLDDGIADVRGDHIKTPYTIYNLTGQRLSRTRRGINIISGRKVLY